MLTHEDDCLTFEKIKDILEEEIERYENEDPYKELDFDG